VAVFQSETFLLLNRKENLSHCYLNLLIINCNKNKVISLLLGIEFKEYYKYYLRGANLFF
jgi:hypothetical protein